MGKARSALFALIVALAAAAGGSGRADEEVVARVGDFALLGSGPSRAVVGVGVFNGFEYGPDPIVPAAHAEFMYGGKIYGIGPLVGLMANTEGGVFGFGGLYMDIRIGEKVVFTPFFAAGGYRQGASRDLGGVFQFRPSFTWAYEFDSGIRLGFNYAHISNAGIHETNGSDEEFHLTLSFPLGF